jgi:hypothetical protein
MTTIAARAVGSVIRKVIPKPRAAVGKSVAVRVVPAAAGTTMTIAACPLAVADRPAPAVMTMIAGTVAGLAIRKVIPRPPVVAGTNAVAHAAAGTTTIGAARAVGTSL